MVRAYRFALDPTPAQEQQLRSHCGAARFAFNHMLEVVKKNMDQRAHPSAQRRWKDSGLQGQRFIGRQHLHQEGQCPSKRARAVTPGCPSGSARRVSSSDCSPSSVARRAGSPGSRAQPQLSFGMRCGTWPSGELGTRGPRTMRWVRTPPRGRCIRLTSNQSQVHGRHLQPHGQHRELLLRPVWPRPVSAEWLNRLRCPARLRRRSHQRGRDRSAARRPRTARRRWSARRSGLAAAARWLSGAVGEAFGVGDQHALAF